MIGHQHVGMDGAVVTTRSLTQVREVASIVDFLEEAGQTVIAALHDLLGYSRKVGAGLAWHGHDPCDVCPACRCCSGVCCRRDPEYRSGQSIHRCRKMTLTRHYVSRSWSGRALAAFRRRNMNLTAFLYLVHTLPGKMTWRSAVERRERGNGAYRIEFTN